MYNKVKADQSDLCLIMLDALSTESTLNSVSLIQVNKSLTENKYTCEYPYLGYHDICIRLQKRRNPERILDLNNCTKKHSHHKLVNALLHLGICKSTMKINDTWTCIETDNQLCTSSHNTMVIHQKNVSMYSPGCINLQFTCYSGDCVSNIFVKDGDYDCYDASDEVYDGSSFTNFGNLLHCDDKEIAWHRVCDSIYDCSDNSDENICTSDQITSPLIGRNEKETKQWSKKKSVIENCTGMFECVASGTCIPSDWVNDLHPDCILANGTYMSDDEPLLNAGHITNNVPDTCTGLEELPCLQGHPQCFKITSIGKYDLDMYGHLYPCRNGAHLLAAGPFFCSGWYNAQDLTVYRSTEYAMELETAHQERDEHICASISIDCSGFFRCKGGMCIHQNQVCDGVPQCQVYGEDEIGCEKDSCQRYCACTWQSVSCVKANIYNLNASIDKYVSVQANGKIFPVITGHITVVLNLSNNLFSAISSGSFIGVPNVATIDLSHSHINTIEKYGIFNLTNLIQLLLDDNPITHLEEYSFNNLPRLTSLNMSHFSIKSIDAFTFSKLDALEFVDLSHCSISTFNISSFKAFKNNLIVYMQDNPIQKVYDAGKDNDSGWYLETDIDYICCFFEDGWCTVSLSDLCVSDITDISVLLSITVPATVIHILYILKLILTKIGRKKQRHEILLSLLGIITCVCSLMAGLDSYLFDRNHIHDKGGERHWWCLVTGLLQHLSICWVYPAQLCFYVGFHALFSSGVTMHKVYYRGKLYLYLIVGFATGQLISFLAIVLSVGKAYGKYPIVGEFCSLYMVNNANILNTLWLIFRGCIALYWVNSISMFAFISVKDSIYQ